MRIAFALAVFAGLASAETHPAFRIVPMAGIGYGYDGQGFEKLWNDASGLQSSVGAQCTFYSPNEDSMGWALVAEVSGDMLSASIEGSKQGPDNSLLGSDLSRMGTGLRVQTGPFYRMLGLWSNSGGLFGARWTFSDGSGAWYRDDYALSFGVYTETGTDPWAREGVRLGLAGARVGGSETWSGVFTDTTVSDSAEWLTEGFQLGGMAEYWRGPVWAQLNGQITALDLRHRSEEGTTGERVTWEIGLRVGYRFALGNLAGFR